MASVRRRSGITPVLALPSGFDRERPPQTVTDAYRFAAFVSVSLDFSTFGSFGAAAPRDEGDADVGGPRSSSRPRRR